MVKIVTVYPKDDGESYLMDVSVDQFTEIVKHIGEGPTRVNTTPSPKVDDYHNASRVQYVVHLSGISEIEVADGTVKLLHPGDILIAQDTTGHGHITRSIGDETRVSMNVPLIPGKWMPTG
ncbi:MAG: hypothetical protein CL886_01385 [Dehalococcoidia bacterium]|nr:hypothetical protein [Dehalococcoidia bacterium]